MRVALDASSIGSGLGGDETMARAMVRALVLGAGANDRIELLLADGAPTGIDVVDTRVRSTSEPRSGGSRHFLWDLPRWVRGLNPAPHLVISFTHSPVGGGVPVALMVPDLSFEHLGDVSKVHPPAPTDDRATPGPEGGRGVDHQRVLPGRPEVHLPPPRPSGAPRAPPCRPAGPRPDDRSA